MKIAVIGAGAMGRGIAQIFAQSGHQVLLHDANAQAIEAALSQIRTVFERQVERNRMTADEQQAAMTRLQSTPELAALTDVDLVIEAIIEALEPKRDLFARLEGIVGAQAILATNTSSLSVTAIASACRHPERVAGFHFFNPVPLMKVVEVIRGVRTAEPVIETLRELATQAGHRAVVATDTPGFIVNHAGRGYTTESLKLLGEGVTDYPDIDRILREQVAFEGKGFRLGPFELLDLTGLDVSHPVMCSIHDQYFGEPRFLPSTLGAQRMAAGLFGRKVGEGFYRYDNGERIAAEAPAPAVVPPPLPMSIWIAPCDEHETLVETVEALGGTVNRGERPGDADAILLAPLGLDLSTASAGFDASRCVALDVLFPFAHKACKRRVLMKSPATDPAVLEAMAALFAADGASVSVLRDSAGFVAQRVIAMIVAIGCEIAQQRIASASDVDESVRIGLGYPLGPISMGDHLGPARIHRILANLYQVTADPRYRPSLWLQRRAQLGLSLFVGD